MIKNQYTPEEPITSIATALSPAALGIIRVSGKNSIQLVSTVFSRPKALSEAKGNSLVYGWIQNPRNDKKNAYTNPNFITSKKSVEPEKIDEVMLGVYRAPKSFTGEDMVEIYCHGGPAVVTSIQKLMLKIGFRQANRGEYTFRAFINGKTDLTKAEAIKEIIESHTDVSRSHAAERLAGNLFTQINNIKKLITDTLAAIEVEIEYPEDEETIADTFDRKDIETAILQLQRLVDSWKGEKLYQDGAKVVLAGRTNAGKSSLFNAILKEERAIVSDIEGTTRDWIESWASINGIPIRLFDTAGLRKTSDEIEAKGVELSKNLAKDADLVFYLTDGTSGINEDDKLFIKNSKEPIILVINKSDKISFAKTDTKDFENIPTVYISAKTGEGLKQLYEKAEKILTAGIATEREQAGLGSARQKEAVKEALECTKHALISADDNYSLDAVVQDLEDALYALSEVTGEITADDILGKIFANFCVGK